MGGSLQVGEWSGTLQELVSGLESGTISAASLDLRAVVAAARSAAADLEAASGAYALLGRAIELKARSLLPSPPAEPEPEEVEEDPEAEAARLAERIAAYQAYAQAAAALREFERRRQVQFGRPEGVRGRAGASAATSGAQASETSEILGADAVEQLLSVFAAVWERSRPRTGQVLRERFTVAEAAARLRERLSALGSVLFADLFAPEADRLEVVVTFVALLELVRLGEVAVRQEGPFAPLHVAWQPGGRSGGPRRAGRSQ